MQPLQQLVGAGRQRLRVDRRRRLAADRLASPRRHVARHFEVDRARFAQCTVEHPCDLLRRATHIVEPRLVCGQLGHHPPLRIERLHLVVQQQPAGGLVRGRRARQHDQRHAFGVGAGQRVDQVEGAGAVSHRGHAQPAAQPRRGVGGEADRRFVRQRVQRQDAGAFDFTEQRQREVAGNAEHFGGAPAAKRLEQALRQVHLVFLRYRSNSRASRAMRSGL
ncbi:hypothetical protein GALL_436210 [mine drainage metagenome]|uniref:Uncharacterized protein n=1 Tax=mine drainage metagenome TaxID=410659 RepID=A0A1J5Q412_9ZZZZ